MLRLEFGCLWVFMATVVLTAPSLAQNSRDRSQSANQEDSSTSNPVSPVRGIDRDKNSNNPPEQRRRTRRFRTFDGSGNNTLSPLMNTSHAQLARWVSSDYSDLIEQLAGFPRPSPRLVSNALNAQRENLPHPRRASDYLWQWGQFLDHDIDLTDGIEPAEPAPIPVPLGDPHFDPQHLGDITIPFNRSLYDQDTGIEVVNPRQQINEITGWIDASNVYGSTSDRAIALRTNDGSGELLTSPGNLLPFNQAGLPNAGGTNPNLFVAGDVRANEQIGLTAMHTLFVREHNRLARSIRQRNRNLGGEEIYQRARRIVGAQMQKITYHEFLPTLLGPGAIPRYQGYNPQLDASVANVFSTAAYRLGHSMLSPQILRLDTQLNPHPSGHLSLRDAFFSPSLLQEEGSLEALFRGLANQVCQNVDLMVIDDVRNFLFGEPGSGGFDLASLNIQRGRDHGLPGYNQARVELGLERISAFSEITSDLEVQDRLASVYDSVDDIDLWVGGLAETPVSGSSLGELFHHIVARQFQVLRDGDRYWYQRTLSGRDLRMVESTTLSEIIRRNTDIGSELQANVFVAGKSASP
ncbi:MAG: peroxidase family protein [Pseudomonadota bacterium]